MDFIMLEMRELEFDDRYIRKEWYRGEYLLMRECEFGFDYGLDYRQVDALGEFEQKLT